MAILVLIGIILFGNNAEDKENIEEKKDEIAEKQLEELEEDETPYEGDDKSDLIVLDMPNNGDVISNPLKLSGKARGNWYFEASFSAILTDWDGKIIKEIPVQAKGEWMTTEFVPFEAVMDFQSPYKAGDPDFMKNGTLILQKANASGLPEHDDALEIRVKFAK